MYIWIQATNQSDAAKEPLMITRSVYPVILTPDVASSKHFYVDHFDFEVVFDADWYASLRSISAPEQELAFLDRDHPSLPISFHASAAGVVINIEVENIDVEYERLKSEGIPMVLDLRCEEWGQRHFIVSDPSGLAVDVIQEITPAEEVAPHLTSVKEAGRGPGEGS
jgi:catechol 2,3-dioxygenase-like lactoylglutathione lyase family enzyme